MERERLKREVEIQRERLQELVQQQMRARPAWQTMLLPALGAGFFALLLGEPTSPIDMEAHQSSDCGSPGRMSSCSMMATLVFKVSVLHGMGLTEALDRSSQSIYRALSGLLQGRCLLLCWEQLL